MGTLKRLTIRGLEVSSLFLCMALVGVGFYGFNALTPQTMRPTSAEVLGAKTEQSVSYTPVSYASISFIKGSSLSLESANPANASQAVTFNDLTSGQLTFSTIQIKNSAPVTAKVKLVPSYSLQSTGISISAVINGVTIQLIDQNGLVTIPEILLDPKSITPVSILINSPGIKGTSTLTLNFVRVE